MLDIEQLQVLAQLVDNLEVLINKLEKSYDKKDGENFNKNKNEILETQQKISGMIK